MSQSAEKDSLDSTVYISVHQNSRLDCSGCGGPFPELGSSERLYPILIHGGASSPRQFVHISTSNVIVYVQESSPKARSYQNNTSGCRNKVKAKYSDESHAKNQIHRKQRPPLQQNPYPGSPQKIMCARSHLKDHPILYVLQTFQDGKSGRSLTLLPIFLILRKPERVFFNSFKPIQTERLATMLLLFPPTMSETRVLQNWKLKAAPLTTSLK